MKNVDVDEDVKIAEIMGKRWQRENWHNQLKTQRMFKEWYAEKGIDAELDTGVYLEVKKCPEERPEERPEGIVSTIYYSMQSDKLYYRIIWFLILLTWLLYAVRFSLFLHNLGVI